MNYSDIVKALPKLSPTELNDLRQRITALQSLGGNTNVVKGADNSEEGWVIGAICRCLTDMGIMQYPSMILNSPSAMSSLREKLPDLLTFLKQFGEQQVAWRAGFSICITLLVRNLRRRHIPATAVVCVRHLDTIPALVDLSFPGYAKEGLLGMIIHTEARR